MSSEGWGNGQQQPPPQQQQFGSRSYGNSNFRGGPRGTSGGATGRSYNGGSSGGWNGQQRSGFGGGGQGGYTQGGYGGQPRQSYGERQPRQSYGQAGAGGAYNFPEGSASNIEIDSNKVGMVIGRGGAKIREIQQNFNVHVKIGKLKKKIISQKNSA